MTNYIEDDIFIFDEEIPGFIHGVKPEWFIHFSLYAFKIYPDYEVINWDVVEGFLGWINTQLTDDIVYLKLKYQ